MPIIEPGIESKQRWRADVFPQQWKIGVDFKIYRARIGSAMGRRTWKRTLESSEVKSAGWFMGIMFDGVGSEGSAGKSESSSRAGQG
jgi:hypothetical protein